MVCTGAAVVSLLISFPNVPKGVQVIIENVQSVTVDATDISENDLKDSLMEINNSEDVKQTEKKGFGKQFKLLMTDPVYLILLFGVLLGSNTIGGQNVSMAVMLKTFDIPEVCLVLLRQKV